MERLNLLSVALGLAALAGVNLYLTVFATGLAIHQHWIALSPQYASLGVLGEPVVIVISGALFALEFFADKIPWLDSAWDAVHTVIRPIGGAFLAIQTLGNSSPSFDVVIALLAGGTALITHSAKAATRLATNTSPEPFSNIALSLGEDVAVVGGLALIYHHPIVAFAIIAAAILTFLYFAPKIWRAMKVRAWLIWRKLNEPAWFAREATTLPLQLPSHLASVFAQENVIGETIAWAVPCASGRGRRIPANIFGALVSTNEEPRKLTFVGKKGGRRVAQAIELDGMALVREPKFLSENLSITPASGSGPRYSFVFPRSRAGEVEQIVETLKRNIARAAEIQPAAVTL